MGERSDEPTPGPWRVMKSGWSWKRFVVSGEDRSPFTGQVIAGETTAPETLANLRLIAAAPCLLAASRELLAAIDAHGVTGELIEFVTDLRAVVARAEGREENK